MKVLFCGSYFSHERMSAILDSSIGAVSNANNLLQHNLISGLIYFYRDIECVTMPNIGAYPHRYKCFFYNEGESTLTYGGGGGVKSSDLSFFNVKVVKHFSKAFSLFWFFIRNLEKRKPTLIYFYDCELAYIIIMPLLKLFGYKIKSCLIIPDLPEMTGSSGGFLFRQAMKLFSFVYKKSLRCFDTYSLVSKPMIKKLDLDADKAVIIEGVFNTKSECEKRNENSVSPKKILLYSGALDERNGVKLLIAAFQQIENEDFLLVVVGDGPLRRWVEIKSAGDKRILYYGQLNHSEVLGLQKSSSLLINPRMPQQDFTAYSFPSKTMEYLASGVPVLMFRLEGVPPEYFDHVYICDEVSAQALRNSILSVFEDNDALKKAANAKEFIYKNKNPYEQCKKLFELNIVK